LEVATLKNKLNEQIHECEKLKTNLGKTEEEL